MAFKVDFFSDWRKAYRKSVSMNYNLHVKLIDKSKTVKIFFNPYSRISVGDIKAKINEQEHISPDQQILVFNGKILVPDEDDVDDHNIVDESILYLLLRDRSETASNLALTGELHKNIQDEIEVEKEQTKTLQNEVEMLKEELSVEKRDSQVFQRKCDYLENTVIPSLLERLKAVEDTVERLWAISRDEVVLSNKILGTGGWGYVTEATYRGRRVAAKCLHEVSSQSRAIR